MLRDSVVVVRTRPRAIPLAMIAIRKILHGFPFPSRDAYGAPLGGPLGRRSSAIKASHQKQRQFNCCFLSLFYFLIIISALVANILSFIQALFRLKIVYFVTCTCFAVGNLAKIDIVVQF